MSDGPATHSEIRISPSQLKGGKARDLALLLESNPFPYVDLVECKAVPDDRYETIVLNIHPEVGQRPVHDIRRIEPIAVKFDAQDETCPEVLALRRDFPRVPHLNLRENEYPRSLCLYDEPYEEVKLHWTPIQFLSRLSVWLRDTAEGTLHRQDQALEPMLVLEDLSTIVIHPDVFRTQETTYFVPVSVQTIQDDSRWPIRQMARAMKPSAATHLLMVIPVPPQTHGIITRAPRNMYELDILLGAIGLNLVQGLRDILAQPRKVLDTYKLRPKDMGVVILLVFQKQRMEGEIPETLEFRAFFCKDSNIFRIRQELGAAGTKLGNGSSLSLRPVNCTVLCERDDLNILSGIEEHTHTKFASIGVGALGSQVLINLARMGFGTWTIIDCDVLLPHNVARHMLTTEHVGKWKSIALADLINTILGDELAAKGIPANLLKPITYERELAQALQESEVIVDMSTSIAASRWLACDCPSAARRVSLFLNPTGTDLVVLAEDADRKVPLDCLEMQYYRHLISHPDSYKNHLSTPDDGVRYGNTCRDVSSRIPQDIIAVMAGIGSRALRLAISDQKAKTTIWRSKDQWLGIDIDNLDVQSVVKVTSDDWTVITDHYVLSKVLDLRKAKLPNETGGILVGSFDAQRRRLYIVDILPAPSDSKESPGSFERGIDGLLAKHKEVNDISAGWLDYVGEWHSHPSGCSCNRSRADCRQCNWIAGNMQIEGLPGLMMIVNDDGCMLYLAYPE